ncbi:hypothetical protein F2Q69_00006302 [Brassica cretica]|uniref:Uncharacterized protein n=1 Tax=Brassica cretica TaxID=69181 RepID=A0A8S9PAD9_BRACR|nr:hypothetical protein F2Q69_00006302 [Brassica cretica]
MDWQALGCGREGRYHGRLVEALDSFFKVGWIACDARQSLAILDLSGFVRPRTVTIKILSTRFIDTLTVRRLGIDYDLIDMMKKLGWGTMAMKIGLNNLYLEKYLASTKCMYK